MHLPLISLCRSLSFSLALRLSGTLASLQAPPLFGGGPYAPIPRVSEAELPWPAFRDLYLKPGVPVIIRAANDPYGGGAAHTGAGAAVGGGGGGGGCGVAGAYRGVVSSLLAECGGRRVNLLSETIKSFLRIIESAGTKGAMDGALPCAFATRAWPMCVGVQRARGPCAWVCIRMLLHRASGGDDVRGDKLDHDGKFDYSFDCQIVPVPGALKMTGQEPRGINGWVLLLQ